MPQLDSTFQTFVTWQTLLFCLGVGIITYVVRTIVEALWKGATTNDLWNEVAVRLGPIGTGVLIALSSKTFPWPTVLVGSKVGLAFYGAVCGVSSAYVYAAFRAWLTVAGKAGFEPARRMMAKKVPEPEAVSARERPTDPPRDR